MKLVKKVNYKMFGKQIYLIGINREGEKVFLEAPSWDCDWYWGFGYLETYTNNYQITRSKDISSHSHFDNFEIDNNTLNHWHTLESCVLSQEGLNELKILMQLAINLGNEAREIKVKDYKNLTEVHNKIISLLS